MERPFPFSFISRREFARPRSRLSAGALFFRQRVQELFLMLPGRALALLGHRCN